MTDKTNQSTKFPLGCIVITSNAQSQLSSEEVQQALHRHVQGDWGNVGQADAAENELSLRKDFRLFSVYGNGTRRFWIITEADRSATTVLMPDDY